MKYRRYGDPRATGDQRPNGLTRDQLFLRKVNKTANHWLWTGKINSRGTGYGDFTYKVEGKPRTVPAHRYAWEMLIGPIPPGMHLDHVAALCTITHCVWPEHLEPVTPGENTRRYYALQTQCKWGHPFDPENTKIIYIDGNPRRICRACGRRRSHEHYARTRQGVILPVSSVGPGGAR
jgi:hypothetical protein